MTIAPISKAKPPIAVFATKSTRNSDLLLEFKN